VDEPDDWLLNHVESGTKRGPGKWSVLPATDRNQPWIRVKPVGASLPGQGWKIHVSSFASNAADTLARALPVLVAGRYAFKVLGSLSWLRGVNSASAGLSQVGKYITVYPETDNRAVDIAVALARATCGLRAPPIPSDHAFDANGVVHYRYGAFGTELMQTALGEILPALMDPDMALTPDRRETTPTLPAWLEDPFAAAGFGAPSYRAIQSAERYHPVATLAETADIVIQLAIDLVTPRSCVVKRTKLRRIDGIEDLAESVRRLRREAAVLARLNGHEIAPCLLDVVDDGNELAVVTEDLGGHTLDSHVRTRMALGDWPSSRQIVDLGAAVADGLAVLHEEGHVHGDVKSGNIVIGADGRARLIDFGLAWSIGCHARPAGAGTRGYISPACLAGEPPTPNDDLYAFGGVLYLLLTGAEPSRAPDADELLARNILQINPRASASLAAIAERCLGKEPHRPFSSAREVARALRATIGAGQNRHQAPMPKEAPRRMTGDELSRRLQRTADFICHQAQPHDGGLVWRSTYFVGKGLLSRDVNSGMAGTVLALAELVDEFGVDRHAETLLQAASSLGRLPSLPGARPQGLYVGEMGVSVALLRAGIALNDGELVAKAVDRARSVASRPMNSPDLFHGMAGQLLGHLLVWDETGDRLDLGNAIRLGETILTRRQGEGERAYWPIPEEYGSLGIGNYLGYAHGAAGIADILLELFEATGDRRYADTACDAISWIAGQAVPTQENQGVAWPIVEGGEPHPPFWCHGATGIARPLLHARRLRLELNCAELLRKATHAIAGAACWSGPTLCHGLAGNADLLIDVWKETGDPQTLDEAYRLLSLIQAFSIESDEGQTWISEAPRQINPDYLVGYAGIATTLLRFARPDRDHALSRAGFQRGRTIGATGRLA
jgi:tRNA A-37 threonylcarbamoyl transferase component Bud32